MVSLIIFVFERKKHCKKSLAHIVLWNPLSVMSWCKIFVHWKTRGRALLLPELLHS